MRAVRFDRYGGLDVLEVREVEDPVAGPGRVLVAVKAAGINPGEVGIREGRLHGRYPATFPSGQGSDLAGVVRKVGEGVENFAAGDEVLGWSEERASQAELVSVPASQLAPKTGSLSWEAAGSLFIAGMAALASVESVALTPGETVAVSAAAGGAGSLAVQLARRTGATVIGLAGEHNHDWLRSHGVVPVVYGEGQAVRLRQAAAGGLDAFIDTFGHGYAQLALEVGVPKGRITTIADFRAMREDGIRGAGTHAAASAERLSELAGLVAAGEIEVPIAGTFPLDHVREAYRELQRRHTRGKIALIP